MSARMRSAFLVIGFLAAISHSNAARAVVIFLFGTNDGASPAAEFGKINTTTGVYTQITTSPITNAVNQGTVIGLTMSRSGDVFYLNRSQRSVTGVGPLNTIDSAGNFDSPIGSQRFVNGQLACDTDSPTILLIAITPGNINTSTIAMTSIGSGFNETTNDAAFAGGTL